ncbi:MAG: TIM barrel protein [Armatimonadota bacterium]
MISYRQDAIDSVIGRSSFGIWDLLNKGSDPFGAPVRAEFKAEDAIGLLGKLSVPRISLHDIDVGLDPWVTTDPKAFDARLKTLQASLRDNGVKVWMYTPCLFHHPMVRAGSVTSNDARVRRASVAKMLTALDVANEFDASWVTFWLGRDGAEIDALIDGKAAYQRIAEAVHVCCAYIRSKGYKLRMTLEPKPNEPRGDIYVSTVGTALGIIGMLPAEDQGLVMVNPELLQHESMAGLNSYHAVGQLVAAGKLGFLHLGGQTPLRYDQDHPFLGGNSDLKQSFYIMLAVAKHAPDCVLEFDCHPFRTEGHADAREEFVKVNLEGAGLMLQKAKSFLALPEVKELLTDTDSLGFGIAADVDKDTAGFVQSLRAQPVDATALAAEINPQAQYLDRLVNLHLLGAL